MKDQSAPVEVENPWRVHGATAIDEAQFRSLADHLPALIAATSPTGELEAVNESALSYFGLTLDQLRSWRSNECVHPEDRPSVIAAWRRAIDAEAPYDFEHRMRRSDGAYRWFHVRAQPLRSRDGRVARWCVLCTDINEHKRATLLSLGEKRVLERVAVGDPLPVVLDAICALLDATADGCTSSVLVLDRTNTRVQHAAAPGLPASYNRALEGQTVSLAQGPCGMAATLQRQVIVHDIQLDTRWDSEGWPALARSHGLRSCWSTPVISGAGESMGTFAIYQRLPGSPTPPTQSLIRQFTHLVSLAIQRTRHEDALRRNQALLAGAEKLSATGCFLLGLSTGEHWWSPETYRVFGVDPSRTPSFDLIRGRVHPDDLEVLEHSFACAQQGRELSMEVRLKLPDGTLKYIQVEARGIRSPDGQVTELGGAVRDVSERRLAEEALGRARSELAHVARVASLGVVTASIAHEVSQPLSGILVNANACLRMLAADPPNVAGAKETVRRTIRDSDRAFAVLAKLRALCTKNAASVEAVDLNDATQEVLALLRSELQSHRVALRTQLASDLPAVRGDRVQLQQVILNLVLNASDAMSGVEGGPRQLLVSTDTDGDRRVRLTVRDSGVGLDAQAVERIFDAFYTTKDSGMGIGLSISRSIIESHQGTLWAAPNDGPGASFTFSVPRLAADDTPPD